MLVRALSTAPVKTQAPRLAAYAAGATALTAYALYNSQFRAMSSPARTLH